MTSTLFCVRDLSTANMIGAKGLLGKSWPDMDMLPLGTLTDPGYMTWNIVLFFYSSDILDSVVFRRLWSWGK